jgi:hypothetical protein
MRPSFSLHTIGALWIVASSFAGAQTPPANVAIGSVPGSFDVTLSGSSSYTVPIKVAPGTAGTEPKIQLVYNSQVPTGPLGMGWAIVGLSTITRGPKDILVDGTIGGILLEDTDALYIDGQRIVPVAQKGTGANREIEYRKWVDDQTRIYQIGATLSTSVFRVQTKGGLLLIFDGSTTGQRSAPVQGK